MTLQEKLEVRRNAARNMKPVNSPERIWEYIRLELLGFTSIELLSGKVICVDVEVKDGQVLITKYILDSETDVKMIAKRERTDVITAYQLLIGGAALILTGYVFGGTMGAFTWKSGILFFYMALLSTAAFSIWAMLLKNNPVSKVTPYGFSNPVFGTLLSGIFLGENIFTWHSFAALGLVSMGIIFVNFEKKG